MFGQISRITAIHRLIELLFPESAAQTWEGLVRTRTNGETGPNADACLIIPMFNEAAVVGDVVASARSAFARVICVDDGSSDGSGDLAQAAGAIVIRHPGNLGAGAALQTGLAFGLGSTRAEYFVTIDADGQHRIEDAIRMLERARESNADVILGSRFLSHESNIPTVRRIVLRAGVAFTRATTGLSITDTHNGLRVGC
jgi:glycosyltransferase involved in cell wall biosynthesis